MTSTHPATLPQEALLKACEVERCRRSGPGGQHRNKVETGIVLTHGPSGVTVSATERRSQAENLNVAVRRLREELALAVRTEVADDDEPSELWRQRANRNRLRVNPDHADFPLLMAEALNWIAAYGYDVAAAGRELGVSTSQLLKFLKLERRALEAVNHRRVAANLRPLF